MTALRPCILIPVYNHPHSIAPTVASILPYGLPIILVDDGSDEPTSTELRRLEKTLQPVQLTRLSQNQGKGGAVMAGMRLAWRQGFSHAIQVDADGQHDVADIQHLLELCRQHPQAVISGQPRYDDSVPRARLYSRYLTHFWVWVETLSLSIRDSMCGFRAYPLEACIQLLDRQALGRRMDFDIEVLVRLYWEGLAVLQFPTRVTYPSDGVSHFRAWQDNWLITRLHTRLVFGMLRRIPRLLQRHLPTPGSERHWSERRERGSRIGIRFMLRSYQWCGRRVFNVLLLPVMLYYFLCAGSARRASGAYLQRVRQRAQQRGLPAPSPGIATRFAHFYCFGQAILDKLSVWLGDHDKTPIQLHNESLLTDALAQGRGALLLGSHLGNLEVCRALGTRVPGLVVNAIVFTEHAQRFNEVIESLNPDARLNLIQVSRFDPALAVTLKQKIDQGELVVIVGDRTSATARERVVRVPFLGEAAPFPQGPFILAALMRCPVMLLFCLRNPVGFDIIFEPFRERLELPRRQRDAALAEAVGDYAARLEHHCLQRPLQWFNFFDFWADNETGRLPHEPTPAATGHR
ncbi:glycosyltransferase family 2 protein [Aestuariirhabdus litorea]|uniref:Glycosyltransferase family 2 protein n=1 Tax=Aestuariirhabdus litorea TaxID=2528527 RepID=A0A3P3VLM3_9GAMM|nr:glycosyltransferase family 2 protein [Aestuariirhabdus litorea]RRJ82778.1 glycosyltransferase family 2 protein [Aestuariirhabdus litorea]RWW92938.1 glycosyltransferase [Endozoicomonadaceae bacterium GTF-13]